MSRDVWWKLGAFLFAAAALPAAYITIIAIAGFDGAPIMRFLGALFAFIFALGIAALYRRGHGAEAGGLERFLVQLAQALVFILLVGTMFPLFGVSKGDQDLSYGMLAGTVLVIAWFGYRYYKSGA